MDHLSWETILEQKVKSYTLDRKRLKIHFLFLFVKVTVVEWTKLFINHFFGGGVAALVWPCKKIICLDIFHDQFWQPYFMSMCKNKLKRGLQLYVWHKLFFCCRILDHTRVSIFAFCWIWKQKSWLDIAFIILFSTFFRLSRINKELTVTKLYVFFLLHETATDKQNIPLHTGKLGNLLKK